MKIKHALTKIEKVLKKSKVPVPIEVKLKTAELILSIMAHKKKKFGLFIILGWQNKWKGYTDVSDMDQDIFTSHRANVMAFKREQKAVKRIAKTVNFDGAILINKKGKVMHSGVILEGLRPRFVAQKINPGHFTDLSEQLGFKQKVHSRHLFAIASSYTFKDTTVFTVSEETNAFHIYESGRIVYEK